MPKKSQPEQFTCQFFCWPIYQRPNGVWYADGRSNGAAIKRTSLGSKDREEAIAALHVLDRVQAERVGLTPRSTVADSSKRLPLALGRKLFDGHTSRPRLVGGTKANTQKRYRAIFDKFLPFLETKRIVDWHQITEQTLASYAEYLNEREYAYKTVFGELNTIKTAFKWLCTEKHLAREPLVLRLRKADCERAYCYSKVEVAAMIKHCSELSDLNWLRDVIIALSCTGLRISELASLKQADVKTKSRSLVIADESGFANGQADRRSTKSSRTRHIPIHSDLQSVLESLRHRKGNVFLGPRGGTLKPDTVRNILVREAIEPLTPRFPKRFEGQRSFEDGRLHSFRHYFCSTCANNSIPERIVMSWLGHSDSEMVRHYYHLSDEEALRQMENLDLVGKDAGRSGVEEVR
ncbi:site-specific tyrosine recombinase XerD [Rubripirellula lacrimiformis]|uniref:Site-specific tyrosine recombinase XerD n=1 Tax=Rubripirellula lacrimiformis TaxID=1930273 RepID=A0A517N7J8_9BACT|nr:site-specific integrase [Rubripirellula lacrimiformis]QDT03117.1 site-specific tyrosine recombinase XerD [Rubripirellula lacrimiformis]